MALFLACCPALWLTACHGRNDTWSPHAGEAPRILPADPAVARGASLTFTLRPAPTGPVVWSVEAPEGGVFGPGAGQFVAGDAEGRYTIIARWAWGNGRAGEARTTLTVLKEDQPSTDTLVIQAGGGSQTAGGARNDLIAGEGLAATPVGTVPGKPVEHHPAFPIPQVQAGGDKVAEPRR